MRLSPEGLKLLKAYEELKLSFYPDQAGKLTIYWGHRVRPGEQFDHTEEQASLILAQDLDVPESCVTTWCKKYPLTQNEFDAVCVFAFNAGVNAFHGSTLLKLLQSGQFSLAAEEFPKWDKYHDPDTGQIRESEGLRKRCFAQRALFLGLPWSPP